MQRIKILIYGSVHGIFFRANTQEQALKLNLKGTVRNTQEGVEVIAEGPEENLKQLIEYCKHGPPGARVTEIKITKEKYTGEFKDFQIIY